MKSDEIKVGRTYRGGKRGHERTVLRIERGTRGTPTTLCYRPTYLKPGGAGIVTAVASFAHWAKEEVTP